MVPALEVEVEQVHKTDVATFTAIDSQCNATPTPNDSTAVMTPITADSRVIMTPIPTNRRAVMTPMPDNSRALLQPLEGSNNLFYNSPDIYPTTPSWLGVESLRKSNEVCADFRTHLLSPQLPATADPQVLIEPSSTFSLFLDEQGQRHIEYFQSKVADLISVSPRAHNYFLKTFYTIAFSNEAILNALAAWGAFFNRSGGGMETARQYITRSRNSLPKSPTSRFEYFISVSVYLIEMGIMVVAGDTSEWHSVFEQCSNLLRQYGGVAKFIRDNGFSNDSKFLISSFQFFDVMSLETLARGTKCSMNSYNSLFAIPSIYEITDYGIDPYQGCCQPIVLLFGEIMNVYVEYKAESRKFMDTAADIDRDAFILRDSERLQYYHEVEEATKSLEIKIAECSPVRQHLESLPSIEEQQLHSALFDVYRLTCQIYLLLYLRLMQPRLHQIQKLLLCSFNLITKIIHTQVGICMNMALLICGILCCTQHDRDRVEGMFQSLYARVALGNVKRVWEVVREAWRRNPDFLVCIDWLDICNDFGWKLSVS